MTEADSDWPVIAKLGFDPRAVHVGFLADSDGGTNLSSSAMGFTVSV